MDLQSIATYRTLLQVQGARMGSVGRVLKRLLPCEGIAYRVWNVHGHLLLQDCVVHQPELMPKNNISRTANFCVWHA